MIDQRYSATKEEQTSSNVIERNANRHILSVFRGGRTAHNGLVGGSSLATNHAPNTMWQTQPANIVGYRRFCGSSPSHINIHIRLQE
jgi:hypothetical protein